MNAHDMLELVPLYALDALEGSEMHAFVAHLESCPECQSALDHYQAVASGLVLDETASDATWSRISAAISSETTSQPTPIRQASNTQWKWFASIAAAAALVVGGFLVAQLLQNGEVTNDDVVAAAERAANEEGAIVGDFLVDDVAVAQVIVAPDGRGYVVPTEDLEPLDPTRTYQLWVINEAEDVISAGVLGANPAPATFTWTGEIAGFALTREVAGGVISSAGDVAAVITDV